MVEKGDDCYIEYIPLQNESFFFWGCSIGSGEWWMTYGLRSTYYWWFWMRLGVEFVNELGLWLWGWEKELRDLEGWLMCGLKSANSKWIILFASWGVWLLATIYSDIRAFIPLEGIGRTWVSPVLVVTLSVRFGLDRLFVGDIIVTGPWFKAIWLRWGPSINLGYRNIFCFDNYGT